MVEDSDLEVVRVQPDTLRDLCVRVLGKLGLCEADAHAVAGVLLAMTGRAAAARA